MASKQRKPEHLHVVGLKDGECQVHDWPTLGLPRRLVAAMRASHPKGIQACVGCIERATVEADRERALA